jgi:hypothetical protein
MHAAAAALFRWVRVHLNFVLAGVVFCVGVLWAVSVAAVQNSAAAQLEAEKNGTPYTAARLAAERRKTNNVYLGTHAAMLTLLFLQALALAFAGIDDEFSKN